MNHFLNRAMSFLKSEDGPTATEYAVMLALIIVLSLAAISGIGTTVSGIFTNLDGSLPTGTSS
ncbi:MAG: Flp family type IVb pilin [Planctomycetes bacterium]|nr:Flp family type IVb pilin [Planctomycetota bacterium]